MAGALKTLHQVDVLLKTVPSSQVRGGLAPLPEDLKFRAAEFEAELSPKQGESIATCGRL